ncbi:hypothetical protein FRC03_006667 [Tulasnella sp. 419]|nr:hypothetical protein FRC03_006667 [Tulasnella sp. 419]
MDEVDCDFQPSRLGTKEHWDSVYDLELKNFQDDSDDEGEIWFGKDSMKKMVKWALEHKPPSGSPFVLDIGCGNGALCIALVEAGYDPNHILGVDYSAGSVQLSQAIATRKSIQNLTFGTLDFLREDPQSLSGMLNSTGGWDLLLDKGTFDAIALSEKDSGGETSVDIYPSRVERLLKPGGAFLITSCNFTEEELISRFGDAKYGLKYHSKIEHKKFSFGGKTGNVVSTVAFVKI